MRRIYSLLLVCCLAVCTWAQTQQGVVKTKGRMVNGKHVAGQGLSGATVTIQGRNAVQSQTNGGFSFPIPNKTFMLQGVQKLGYQLVDPDATRKAYQYSPNTFYIVMETPDQQSEDKLAAERKIRRTLQRQLQQREDELEELKAQNKLTQKEYRKAMQQLYTDQQNNEKLIADMAKEYAEMDYDQMDELNRQISDAILNGELTKADSLLRSKGDVNSRIAEVRKAQRAEAQEEAELAQRQENLAASKEGTNKKLEDLARDCKNYFDRFKMSNQHDSAAYYIELRAELDTMNAEWQFDAAHYLRNQNQNRKAQVFYERALSLFQQFAKEEPQTYEPWVALTLNNLAAYYATIQRTTEAKKMYIESLSIYGQLAELNPHFYVNVAWTLNNLAALYRQNQQLTEAETIYKSLLNVYGQLAEQNPTTYKPDLARTRHNLAILYANTQRLTEAETMYQEALSIYRHLAEQDPQAYEQEVAATLLKLANLYSKIQRQTEAETMYQEALGIFRHLAEQNPQTYEPELAWALHDLAHLYQNTKHNTEAEAMYQEALTIFRNLAEQNPQPYEPKLATTLQNLANLYSKIQRQTEAEMMYQEALDIFRHLAEQNPQVYEIEVEVAKTLHNLAYLYQNTKHKTEAETMYKEALGIFRYLTEKNSMTYEPYLANEMNSLANLYRDTRRLTEAEEMYQKELCISRRLAEQNPQAYTQSLANTLGSYSFLCIFMKKNTETEQYAREGLAVDSTQHWIASNLAAALLFQGKYAEAEHIYRQYKDELKEGFLDDFKQYAEAGVIPKEYEEDVEKIKKMLNE